MTTAIADFIAAHPRCEICDEVGSLQECEPDETYNLPHAHCTACGTTITLAPA